MQSLSQSFCGKSNDLQTKSYPAPASTALQFDSQEQIHTMSFRGGSRGGRGGFTPRGGAIPGCAHQISSANSLLGRGGSYQQSYGPPASVLGAQDLSMP